jgi:hypothetical protein
MLGDPIREAKYDSKPEQDLEKRMAVFQKDLARSKELEHEDVSTKSHRALNFPPDL